MHWQPHHEVAVIFIELEFGGRGAVLLHGFDNLWNTCGSTFCKFQFLEKFPDAPVAVTPWPGMAGAELLQPHRTIRPRVAEDKQLIAFDSDFDRFARVVAPVIDRIDDSFFDGHVGKIFDPGRFSPPAMLYDSFGNQAALDVIERVSGHAGYRPLEYFFREFVAARPFLGKPDDVDLHHGEETPGFGIEHHQSDVERKRRLFGTADHAHLPAQFQQRERARRFG